MVAHPVSMRPRLVALALLSALLAAPAPAATKKAPARAEKVAVPAKDAGKEAGKDNAKVAKGRLFAVVLGPGEAWKRGQPFKGPGLDQHRRYWKELHGDGKVASAGPLGTDTGLALVRAQSQREAEALIAADPAVKARLLRGVARPYASELESAAVLTAR